MAWRIDNQRVVVKKSSFRVLDAYRFFFLAALGVVQGIGI
jgi:hypothetical protein